MIVHVPTTHEALFAEVDAEGNTVATPRAQVSLAAITPLAALELYEQLHAARNELRRARGCAEIPTPDAALVLLAALRRLDEVKQKIGAWGDVGLDAIVETVRYVVEQIQINRLESVTEEAMNGVTLTEEHLKAAMAPSIRMPRDEVT